MTVTLYDSDNLNIRQNQIIMKHIIQKDISYEGIQGLNGLESKEIGKKRAPVAFTTVGAVCACGPLIVTGYYPLQAWLAPYALPLLIGSLGLLI